MTFLFPIFLSIFFIKFQIGEANPIDGTNYRYKVSGTLNCFDKKTGTFKPATEGEKIDLYEDDFWGDDHMATSYTDKDGKFSLVGTEDEGNEPEPYLYIDGACGGWIRYLCLYPRVQEQRVIINMGRGGDKDTVSINGTTVLALLPMARNCNDLGIWPKSILGPEEGGGGH